MPNAPAVCIDPVAASERSRRARFKAARREPSGVCLETRTDQRSTADKLCAGPSDVFLCSRIRENSVRIHGRPPNSHESSDSQLKPLGLQS